MSKKKKYDIPISRNTDIEIYILLSKHIDRDIKQYRYRYFDKKIFCDIDIKKIIVAHSYYVYLVYNVYLYTIYSGVLEGICAIYNEFLINAF